MSTSQALEVPVIDREHAPRIRDRHSRHVEGLRYDRLTALRDEAEDKGNWPLFERCEAELERRDSNDPQEQDAPQPVHRHVVELWSPESRNCQMWLPEHVAYDAPDAEAALQMARAAAPAGWLCIVSSHVRSRCVPPHPGRD